MRVYLGDVWTPSQALLMLVSRKNNKKTFPYLFWNIYILVLKGLPVSDPLLHTGDAARWSVLGQCLRVRPWDLITIIITSQSASPPLIPCFSYLTKLKGKLLKPFKNETI